MARSASKKFGLELAEFDIYREKLARLAGGEEVKKAIDTALEKSRDIVAKRSAAAMQPHRLTGRTAASIITDSKPEWEMDKATISVGFDIAKGGLPSIFLMYGTTVKGKRHEPAFKEVYDAVYGKKTREEIVEVQKQAFIEAIEKVMK